MDEIYAEIAKSIDGVDGIIKAVFDILWIDKFYGSDEIRKMVFTINGIDVNGKDVARIAKWLKRFSGKCSCVDSLEIAKNIDIVETVKEALDTFDEIMKELGDIRKRRFSSKEECVKYFMDEWEFTRDQAERTCEYVMEHLEKGVEERRRMRDERGGRVREVLALELYGKEYDELSDDEKDKICRIVRIAREK